MTSRTRRRLTSFAGLGVGVAAVGAWVVWLDASLARTAYATGYALYAMVLFLASYHLRKKLAGLPLGSSRAWLQTHLYAGVGSGGLFAWHLGGRWPDGLVEGVLAAVFAATFLSGLVGLYLTRTIPKQLARTGEQFVYERIPRLRSDVARAAREAVLGAVRATGAETLADFYADRLHGFFTRPRSTAYAMAPSAASRKRLFGELTATRRLLTEPEREAAETLFTLIRQKDDLDFHAVRQGLLKKWLFVHLALTWGLLILGAAHGVLALAFRGGAA